MDVLREIAPHGRILPFDNNPEWSELRSYAIHLAQRIIYHKPRRVIEFGGGIPSLVTALAMKHVKCGEYWVFTNRNEDYSRTIDLFDMFGIDTFEEPYRVKFCGNRYYPMPPIKRDIFQPPPPMSERHERAVWYDTDRVIEIVGLDNIDMLIISPPSKRGQYESIYPAIPALRHLMEVDTPVIVAYNPSHKANTEAVGRWQKEWMCQLVATFCDDPCLRSCEMRIL